ncbi:MAG: hypothetical protein HYS81_03040 [Candidatus Aenigmatarchaeota archaeon]|nr:MAG: hypothetical protein HYS81_03040 [Candidatus Aenigmarchaeota archaeon]
MTVKSGSGFAKRPKGFVITMDAMLAAVVVIAAIASVSNSLEVGQTDVWKEDSLYRYAQDVLLVLDRNGTFTIVASSSAGNATLAAALDDLMPVNLGANVTLRIYTDANNDGVFEERSVNAAYAASAPTGWSSSQAVAAKRIYTKYNDSSPTNSEYGVAVINLWTAV